MIDFSTSKFSNKALDFLEHSNKRLNILHGSVRSSKTVNCTLRWIAYCLDGPPGDLMMVGKTVATLQRNVLNDLFDIIGSKNYKWVNRQQGEMIVLGRRMFMVGANSEEAETKIRGATLAGALCDEISLYPRSFVEMLMTRLSVKGAMCFCNCNPGDPTHWFYTDFIKNDDIKDKAVWHFTLEDNPNLDPDYVDFLKTTFTGVFYQRFIEGLWVAAEGVIYRKFADNPDYFVWKEPEPSVNFSIIGVDFGAQGSGHAFNCTGFLPNSAGFVTLDDYWSVQEFDAEQLATEFLQFVKRQIASGRKVIEIRADHAETVLIRTLRKTLVKAGIGIPVKNAFKKEVNDRIRFYDMMFGVEAYWIMPYCQKTIEAFRDARWDESTKKKGKRLDDGTSNIDSLDAQEYSTEPYMKQLIDVLVLGGRKSA